MQPVKTLFENSVCKYVKHGLFFILSFWPRVVTLFFALLVLNLLHRAIAISRYYQLSVKPVYMPENTIEVIRILWAAHSESILTGLREDALFSFAAAVALALLPVGNWLRVVAIVLLAFFLAANLEHILYNFTHINIGTIHNALDVTFVKGQLSESLFSALAVLLVGALATARLLTIPVFRRLGLCLAAPVLMIAFWFPDNFSFTQPAWMQSHPLLPSLSKNDVPTSPRNFAKSAFETVNPPAPIQGGYNVLLVYMEGLSHISIQHGNMSTLLALAEENISFTRYLGNQIVTANGLYTSLTGDFPYFDSKELKWDELEPSNELALGALPALFRNSGYHTAFLQSAPLGFMNKGKVLPILGFNETLGRTAWDHYYSKDGWGIDDRALFEQVLEYVMARPPDQPWFVSVLTTGTHSPYNIPVDFMPNASSDRYRALAYLDLAIADLMNGLQAKGLLDNTVVIFTSDESRENALKSPPRDQLILNWLPLVVRHPSQRRETLDFFVSSHRFPEIIATLIEEPSADGLSSLNSVNVPKIMGNAYADRLFWFEEATQMLLSCNTRSFICAEFSEVSDPMTMANTSPDRTAYYPNLEVLLSQEEASE